MSMEAQILSGRPGSAVESSLTIITQGINRPSRYEITPMDLGQTPKGTTYPVPTGTGARSCADWIRIPDQVEIPPRGSISVPFSIDIPGGARGGYYAYIQVKHLAERPAGERVVVLVEPTLSVKVELEIPGTNPMSLSIESISYDPSGRQGLPGMMVDVKNDGYLKASLEGDVLLYRSRTTFPVRAQIPTDELGRPYVIYPGLSRSLECSFETPPRPGDYLAEVRLLMAGQWRTKSRFDITIPRSASDARIGESLGRSEFDIDIGVDPDYLEVTLPPGATRTASVRVQNRDTLKVHGTASVVKVVQEPNGFLTFADIEDTTGQWVHVSPAEWSLEPRSTKVIMLEITAPESELETVEQCAVRIIGAGGMDETNWLSEADLGIPIIAVPPGAPPPELQIEELDIVRPAPNKNPTAAVLAVRNEGGRTARISGKLMLERASNSQVIQTMHISRMQGLVLPPGVRREFRMPLTYLDRDRFRIRAEVSVAGKPKTLRKSAFSFECTQGPG